MSSSYFNYNQNGKRFVNTCKAESRAEDISLSYTFMTSSKQHQNEVNEIRAERLARTANPLALVTQNTQYSSIRSQQSTRNRGKAIVTSSAPIMIQNRYGYEDGRKCQGKGDCKLMAIISLSFKKIYKPTNNNLRTSSNISRVNQDNSLRINRGTGYDNQRAVNVVGARENVDLKKFQAELDKYNDVNYVSKVEIDCVKAKGDLIYEKGALCTSETILHNVNKQKEAQIKLCTKLVKKRNLFKVIALEKQSHGCYNDNLALMLAPESDETIRLDKEIRSKLSDLIRPFDYEKLNNLYDLFVRQRGKLVEIEVTEEKPSIEDPPELELKDLPSHLEYAFLEENDKLPVIIAKGLKNDEKYALLKMLERLGKNEFYCFLDGFSGYYQIPIDPKDQEKTTFTCPYGTFTYRRMPFGLCNAPSTFQRCMMAIFHDMIKKTMEVFMDDFSVFGDSFDS
ncbi:reverse transcriptase domain-containing protein [Tanacetum coccineum]